MTHTFCVTGDKHPNPIILSFTGGTRIRVISCRPVGLSFVHDCSPRPGPSGRSLRRTTRLVGGTREPLILMKRKMRLNGTRSRLHTFVRGTSVPYNYALLKLSTVPASRPLGGKVLNVRKGLKPGIGAGRYSILVTMNVHFSSHMAKGLSACTGRTGIVRLSVSRSRVSGGMGISMPMLNGYGRALTVLARLVQRGGRSR